MRTARIHQRNAKSRASKQNACLRRSPDETARRKAGMELQIAPCSNAEYPCRLGYAHCLVSGCFRAARLARAAPGESTTICPILLQCLEEICPNRTYLPANVQTRGCARFQNIRLPAPSQPFVPVVAATETGRRGLCRNTDFRDIFVNGRSDPVRRTPSADIGVYRSRSLISRSIASLRSGSICGVPPGELNSTFESSSLPS
jgi:hypothetical protein